MLIGQFDRHKTIACIYTILDFLELQNYYINVCVIQGIHEKKVTVSIKKCAVLHKTSLVKCEINIQLFSFNNAHINL